MPTMVSRHHDTIVGISVYQHRGPIDDVPPLALAVLKPFLGTLDTISAHDCSQGSGISAYQHPIPYVPPVDHHEKRDSVQIKVKLPDGTHFSMSAFRAGNNEDYI